MPGDARTDGALLMEIIAQVTRKLLRRIRRWKRPRQSDEERVAWERQARQFYALFIRPGAVCFDVGANLGNRTKVFLELGAHVVAIEPQQICVQTLQERFGDEKHLTIVQQALGAEPGSAELLISDIHTTSSLSRPWVERVTESGRFANRTWGETVTVSVTTLDHLIERHGVPAFVKIDVEGYEREVLRGLSQPVPALSFEFTPEFLEAALESIEHLNTLGSPVFNYALGESMQLAQDAWVGGKELGDALRRLPKDTVTFGDVYARFDGV